jgi:chromosomal replication initiator protein
METRTQFGEVNFIKVAKYKPTPKVKTYSERGKYTIDDILKVVCDYYAVPHPDIQSRSQKGHIVKARQIAMYFSRRLTRLSLEQVGKEIGNRDYSTVIHAFKTINNRIETERYIKIQVDEIEKLLWERK